MYDQLRLLDLALAGDSRISVDSSVQLQSDFNSSAWLPLTTPQPPVNWQEVTTEAAATSKPNVSAENNWTANSVGVVPVTARTSLTDGLFASTTSYPNTVVPKDEIDGLFQPEREEDDKVVSFIKP